MSEMYFLDIPIYRCTSERHAQEMEDEKQRLLNLGLLYDDEIPESYVAGVQRLFESSVWYPWRYNEIIGWIRLFALGFQIRGEYWFIRAKRIRRDLRRKRVYYSGKTFEHSFHPDESAAKIYEEICRELERLQDERPFKGRHLDLDTFRTIGSFIKWRQLIGFDAE